MSQKFRGLDVAKVKEIMDDPVKWAQVFVTIFDNVQKKKTPWVARWYQSEMLQDRSVKKVARCGRRTGKCLPGDVELINPNTGELITVEQAYNAGRAHIGTMTDEYKLVPHFTNEIWINGVKPVYELTTQTGRKIQATGNHPFFTVEGWKELDDLSVGESVGLANNTQFFGDHKIDANTLKMLAYMIGDGNCTNKTLRFSSINTKHIQEMKSICSKLGCEMIQYDYNKSCDFNIVKTSSRNNRTVKNNIKEILIKHDVYGKGAHDKNIPKEIFTVSKKQVALFLSRLYATDGWASTSQDLSKRQIGYCSVSLQLIKDIQHLLLRFGINSRIESKKSSYTLAIYDSANALRFCNEIGIYGKEDAIDKVKQSCTDIKSDYVPKAIMDRVLMLAENKSLSKKDLCVNKNERVRSCYDITKSKLKQYAEVLDDEDLMNLSQTDIVFDKITNIEYVGDKQTYDIGVSLTGNFIANDFVTHNTETMCLEMLWKADTRPYHRILVVTPYENQVRLIFTRLNEIISESPLLAAKVKKSTKNPYWIEFHNGAIILGFTTGASSGSGGASIRGQRADAIYMDEVDYMSEADFDSVMAIAGERSDITIFMSSTPTGKRSKFWAACTDRKMGFTEHYHPSTHNPNWGPAMEAEFRAQLSEQGFVHEIMAEFGTQDTGVFDKAKVDGSIQKEYYAYNELDFYQQRRVEDNGMHVEMMMYDKYNPAPYNPFRTLGVDWDKYGASSSIIILDYDVISGQFKVIKRVEVPRGEYSYDNAVKLIIELNEIYRPSWVYCDAGAGEYQIEKLRLYGEEHPDSGLKNKVKRWQFRQSVDITDPITGEIDKTPFKTLMINQLQIGFERDSFVLSPFDEVLHKQFIDYEVEKIAANGQPVFTSKNEHFIDAFGLAYMAFVLEFPELVKVMKQREQKAIIERSSVHLGSAGLNRLFNSIETSAVPKSFNNVINSDPEERRGDKQTWVKVPLGHRNDGRSGGNWGARSCSRRSHGGGRSMW